MPEELVSTPDVEMNYNNTYLKLRGSELEKKRLGLVSTSLSR
jgi:hypothetical protein